jgi:hypothetical protein
MKKFFLVVFTISLVVNSYNSPAYSTVGSENSVSSLTVNNSGKKKTVQVKKNISARRVLKRQSAKDRKKDRDYKKFIKRSQKRTIEIQTPEVQARMKKDKKDSAARDKAKKKKTRTSSRKAGKKYN